MKFIERELIKTRSQRKLKRALANFRKQLPSRRSGGNATIKEYCDKKKKPAVKIKKTYLVEEF